MQLVSLFYDEKIFQEVKDVSLCTIETIFYDLNVGFCSTAKSNKLRDVKPNQYLCV